MVKPTPRPKGLKNTRAPTLSLSPPTAMRKSAALSPSATPPLSIAPLGNAKQPESHIRCDLAMSKAETVLLSATGDVLVCRGRKSSKAYFPRALDLPSSPTREQAPLSSESSWFDCETLENCELFRTHANHVHDSPVETGGLRGGSNMSDRARGRLLGGAPPQEGSPELATAETPSTQNGTARNPKLSTARGETSNVTKGSVTKTNGSVRKRRDDHSIGELHVNPAAPFDSGHSPDDGKTSFLSVPSFDYSHFADDGNDMIPATHERNQSVVEQGKPSFLSALLEGDEIGERDDPARTPRGKNGKPGSAMRDAPLQPVLTPQHREKTPERPIRNEMTSEARDNDRDGQQFPSTPVVMHGVPHFLHSLSQIRVTQVSAHPLGSHVLLISAEALLFSYGLNDHGQLGIGRKSSVSDFNHGFVTTPIVVTPLLENGGKAITCAAGVDHSLVVVKTDGRRVGRLQEKHRFSGGRDCKTETHAALKMARVTSSPSRIVDDKSDEENNLASPSFRSAAASELMCHHQVYGFGRNDCMKLGLVNPPVRKHQSRGSEDEQEDVLLPRRVSLHCSVWPGTKGRPSAGVFAIAASVQHSAALVRRATGAIELYTWGNNCDGALGIAQPEAVDINAPERAIEDPLSAGSHGGPPIAQTNEMGSTDPSGSAVSPAANGVKPGEHHTPRNGVVPFPTIVKSLSYIPVLDRGRQPPLHGRAGTRAMPKAGSISTSSSKKNSAEYPAHVALGPACTFVVTSSGRCVSFGTSKDGLLGHGCGITIAQEPADVSFAHSTARRDAHISSVSVGARHAVALGRDGSVFAWGTSSSGRLGFGNDSSALPRDQSDKGKKSDIQWIPRRVTLSDPPGTGSIFKHVRSFSDHHLERALAACQLDGERSAAVSATDSNGHAASSDAPVIHACAGYDSTVFVTSSGRVLSCGRKSGRLGVGETSANVYVPKPMFGGLHLWRKAGDTDRYSHGEQEGD